MKNSFFYFLLLLIPLAFLNIGKLMAETPNFTIVCELSSEASFKMIVRNQTIIAGYTFRGVEIGSPAICVLKENDLINLLCEDQNINTGYRLSFIKDFKGSAFEILKNNSDSAVTEKLAPCFEEKE